MKRLTITLTDGQYAALALDVIDPREWIKSVAVQKADAIVAALPEPIWRACIVDAAKGWHRHR